MKIVRFLTPMLFALTAAAETPRTAGARFGAGVLVLPWGDWSLVSRFGERESGESGGEPTNFGAAMFLEGRGRVGGGADLAIRSIATEVPDYDGDTRAPIGTEIQIGPRLRVDLGPSELVRPYLLLGGGFTYVNASADVEEADVGYALAGYGRGGVGVARALRGGRASLFLDALFEFSYYRAGFGDDAGATSISATARRLVLGLGVAL